MARRKRAAGPARAGRRRHARQDHDHVDARLDPRARGPASPASWSAACRSISASPRAWATGQRPFVIEADEYDTAFFDKRSKFVHYRPRTAVLNNLEFDHADIFDDLAAIERQFHHLVRTVPSTGRVVVNGLEESLARVLHVGCWSEVRAFGAAVSDFTRRRRAARLRRAAARPSAWRTSTWDMTGRAQPANALAAIAAAEHVGVPPEGAATRSRDSAASSAAWKCAATCNGITVYDDFAHHPTAIRTTVDGLRRKVGRAAASSPCSSRAATR